MQCTVVLLLCYCAIGQCSQMGSDDLFKDVDGWLGVREGKQSYSCGRCVVKITITILMVTLYFNGQG